jgi:glyoxylase-like metal-dependent hydrolase (beta-lactamase superfamily II)
MNALVLREGVLMRNPLMMQRLVLLGVLVAVGAVGIAARQQDTVTIEKVRDNLFMIRGGGGNTAAFITTKGVVLVDTKNPGMGQAIMDQVRSVTDKPVTTIINTHTHADHNGSNEHFPTAVEIVTQENTKANMEKMTAFQGEKTQFLPDRTFADRLTLNQGPDRVELYYFGPGHTNGDAIVVFPALRVAHTGDLFARAGTPLIDSKNGGSGIRYPQTVNKAAATIENVETVIPGHSDVTTWAAFAEFGEFNQAFLDAVRAAMKEGKTADEAAAALSLPEKFKAYTLSRVKENVTAIYEELKTAR